MKLLGLLDLKKKKKTDRQTEKKNQRKERKKKMDKKHDSDLQTYEKLLQKKK